MPVRPAPTLRVRGVTHRSPDEARVAADELEHRGSELARNLRADGKDAQADLLEDRANADAGKLRAWARETEAADAAATAQPENRPARAQRRSPARKRSSGGGGGRGGNTPSSAPVEAAILGNTAAVGRDVARDAARIPVVGSGVLGAADLAWTGVGVIVGLALVYALVNEKGHGPAAVGQLAGAAGSGLRRFLDPHDPFLLGHKPGHETAESWPTVHSTPVQTTATGVVTAPGAGPKPIPGAGGRLQVPPSSVPAGYRLGSLPLLYRLSRIFGLHVTDVDTPGVHVPGSYHYQHRAIDVQAGPALNRFATGYALHHPTLFKEFFWPGPWHIKNGRIAAGTWDQGGDTPGLSTGPHGHIAI